MKFCREMKYSGSALYSLNKHAGMHAHYGVKRMDFIPAAAASYFSVYIFLRHA